MLQKIFVESLFGASIKTFIIKAFRENFLARRVDTRSNVKFIGPHETKTSLILLFKSVSRLINFFF